MSNQTTAPNTNDSDHQTAHTRYIQIAHDCRDGLIETLSILRGSPVDPDAVFINQENGHTQRTNTIHRAMNSNLLSYYDHLLPYHQSNLEEFWDKTIDTVQLGNKTKDVSLANLSNWRGYQVSITRQREGELESGSEETTVERAWIPISTAGKIQNELDKCLVELGWAGRTGLKVVTDPDPI